MLFCVCSSDLDILIDAKEEVTKEQKNLDIEDNERRNIIPLYSS
jgi:hypothetical protein